MVKTFDKMNKTELEAATKFLKLEDEVAKAAKDPDKITNAEYVTVLESFKEKQDKANPEEAQAIKTAKVKSKAVTPRATKAEEKVTMTEDYKTMVPVIITDHDTSIVVEEDEERRTVAIRWGNPVIGMTTVNIPLHGRMQYVQKGAIVRLKKIPLASHIKDANGRETSNLDRKRFSVADTTGWTPEMFASMRKAQQLKKVNAE